MKQSPHRQLLLSDKLSTVAKQITEINGAANSPTDLVQIANLVCDELGFYGVRFYLLVNRDETVQFLRLVAGSGEAGLEELRMGSFPKGVDNNSLYGWVAKNHRARIALDVDEDVVRFANPLLPDTRSEMALPLTVEGKLIGVLDIQSIYEFAFSEDEITLLQPIADCIALILHAELSPNEWTVR